MRRFPGSTSGRGSAASAPARLSPPGREQDRADRSRFADVDPQSPSDWVEMPTSTARSWAAIAERQPGASTATNSPAAGRRGAADHRALGGPLQSPARPRGRPATRRIRIRSLGGQTADHKQPLALAVVAGRVRAGPWVK